MKILIVGLSTRAIAESAVRGGYQVDALDAFGDLDLQALVRCYSLKRDFHVAFSAAALFVASRRVGKAVKRNRAKRAMRAAWQSIAGRLVESEWHLGWIARPSCAAQGMRIVESEMEDLLRRAGLRPEPAGLERDRDSRDHRT